MRGRPPRGGRAGRPAPTGIERVELAYAQHFLAERPDRLKFAAMTSWGRFGALPERRAAALVETLARVWHDNGRSDPRQAGRLADELRLALILGGETVLHRVARSAATQPIYLLVSHHHLDRPAPIARLKQRTGARFVALVHDVIPFEYPEYVRPGHGTRHQSRMTTVATLADGIIFNSAATERTFRPFLARAGRNPAVVTAPLGTEPHPPGPSAPEPGAPGLFVCIGTIEPRKNHLLLLNLWRRLAEELGPAAPRLVIVGQRGWENENVVDMLERCPAIQGLVEEHNDMSDGALTALLRRASALLMPSFAEGYGLPIAEALALGVPVLCSDLAVFREVGGEAAEYLDPLDGPGWRAAVLDYASLDSPRRRAQLERIAAWPVPLWPAHFRAVEAMLAAVAAVPAAPRLDSVREGLSESEATARGKATW